MKSKNMRAVRQLPGWESTDHYTLKYFRIGQGTTIETDVTWEQIRGLLSLECGA